MHRHTKHPSIFSPTFRLLCALVAMFFLAGCMKTIERKPMQVQGFWIDWEKLNTQKIQLAGGVMAEGVVLTPAQLPLEASLKRLAQMDFVGFFQEFDISFTSSSLDHDVLQNLFAEGYVPALVRVHNPTQEPKFFAPMQINLMADGETTLLTVPPETLPDKFHRVDWGKTTVGIIVSLLIVFIILASLKDGKSPRIDGFFDMADAGIRAQQTEQQRQIATTAIAIESGEGAPPDTSNTSTTRQNTYQGMLTGVTLPPGGTAEGFVFFQLDSTVVDWRTVQLAPL